MFGSLIHFLSRRGCTRDHFRVRTLCNFSSTAFVIKMIVTTVVCHHFHWLPILLVPAGLRVHIISSDHSDGIPAWLVNRLTGFVFALGFHRVSCDHEVRDFPCRSVCGAVSFNFIGFRLGLCPRVTKYSAVWHLHGYLRDRFEAALMSAGPVSRPWVWGFW